MHPRCRPSCAALGFALGLALLAAVALAPPAAAHGDAGVLEIVERTPNDTGDEVGYLLALTYESDGHEVDGATVTATPELAGVGPQPAVTLTPTGAGGGYEGTLRFPAPGTWTVTFTSAEPEATVTDTVEVRSAPNPTAAPVPSTTGVPATTPPTDGARLADDGEADDDGPPVALFVGIGVAAVALGAAAVVAIRHRRGTPGT